MSEEGKRLCIPLEGALTIYTAAESKVALLQAIQPGVELEFDLGQVDEIDCAGLQLLVLARQEAARQGSRLQLTNHSPAVTGALELSGLADLFENLLVEQWEQTP